MKKGGGKRKGSGFEREVSKIISLFWSEVKKNDLCWRSVSSGARGTTSRTSVKGYHADLAAVSEEIQPLFNIFSIECKFYKSVSVSEVLKSNRSLLIKFWKQTIRTAKKSKRLPVLIYKQNRFPIMIVLRWVDLLLFNDSGIWKNVNLKYINLGGKLCIMNFLDLLKSIHLNKFKEWVYKRNGRVFAAV